jgi:hypothetical protein
MGYFAGVQYVPHKSSYQEVFFSQWLICASCSEEHNVAPMAIKNYNKFMGGVDCHERLRSNFSLGKRHSFHKYYMKLFLSLCDNRFTNAWIYYHLSNPKWTEWYGSRADFFEAIAEALVNHQINWAEKGLLQDSYNDAQLENTNCSPYVTMKFSDRILHTCTNTSIEYAPIN